MDQFPFVTAFDLVSARRMARHLSSFAQAGQLHRFWRQCELRLHITETDWPNDSIQLLDYTLVKTLEPIHSITGDRYVPHWSVIHQSQGQSPEHVDQSRTITESLTSLQDCMMEIYISQHKDELAAFINDCRRNDDIQDLIDRSVVAVA